jgi:hypothetical protein
MSLASMIMGQMDIDKMVNEYIETIFTQIAKKEGVSKLDLEFIMRFDGKNGKNASKYIIVNRDNGHRKEAIFLPDDVVKKIIINAKR